jgi:hypothetical protein
VRVPETLENKGHEPGAFHFALSHGGLLGACRNIGAFLLRSSPTLTTRPASWRYVCDRFAKKMVAEFPRAIDRALFKRFARRRDAA